MTSIPHCARKKNQTSLLGSLRQTDHAAHRTGLENGPKNVARKISGTRASCMPFLKHSYLLGSKGNQHLHCCKAQFVLKPCKREL